MRKNFGPKPVLYPQPVFIIAAYDEEGRANAKLRPITFDPMNYDYLVLGEKVGNAFHDGAALRS